MNRKAQAAFATALFLFIGPGTVAGLVPWWISRWRFQPPFLGLEISRSIGGFLIDAGALVLLDSFRRFAIQGLGTPAPVFPTVHLVISGCYRHVRNPMYAAIVSTLLGQGMLFGNTELLAYSALVWLAMHLFVLFYEEPKLLATFGEEYQRYRDAVPRWIPRARPWRR